MHMRPARMNPLWSASYCRVSFSALYFKHLNRVGDGVTPQAGSRRAADSALEEKRHEEPETQKRVRKGVFLSPKLERGKKNRGEMEKVVRYHIPAVAVACSEYPGEIPEVDHMVTIEDRLQIGTTWSILLNYILQCIIFPFSVRKFCFMLELHRFSKRTLQENKLLFWLRYKTAITCIFLYK